MHANTLTRRFLLLFVLQCGITATVLASEPMGRVGGWSFDGHAKLQNIHTRIPTDSVLHPLADDSLHTHNLEIRLKAHIRRNRWEFDTQLQSISVNTEILGGLPGLPQFNFYPTGLINDERRWFNLTHGLNTSGKYASVMRLDRINIAYMGEKTVFRIGRQAISWGNGLLFTPMDMFNPFDPATVDKEYKTGDDMFYAQYLLANGNDIQTVAVVRRDPASGKVRQDQSSLAVKFHGFSGRSEYDLLFAEHYGERVLGLAASTEMGGAIIRGDLVWNDTGSDAVVSAVGGISYSGVTGGHNWTGLLEYYYNGFGQLGGDYSSVGFAANPELLERLGRGELFNVGRHYIGVSVTIEATPLTHLTSNMFVNTGEPSALAQVVLSYDWKQDIQLLAALNVPVGPDGSEYGGIETGQTDQYISTGASLFVQLAWYF